MVFVKSQDVKLKRMKYHDPTLWGKAFIQFNFTDAEERNGNLHKKIKN